MKCPYSDCGNELPDDILKCIYCGRTVQTKEEYEEKIRKRSEAERLKEIQAKQVKESDSTKDSGEDNGDQTEGPKSTKRKVPLLLLLLAAGIAVAVIGSKIIMSDTASDHPLADNQAVETQAQADSEDSQSAQTEQTQSPEIAQTTSGNLQGSEGSQTTSGNPQGSEGSQTTGGDLQDVNTQPETVEEKAVEEDKPAEPGKIMGWVVDEETGKAVQDARVVLKDTNGKIYPDNEVLKTDENGAFSVQLPAGDYSLSITKKDYLDNTETNNVEVKSKEITKLSSIKLKQDPTVRVVTEYYILPYSNSRYLTDADLDPLSEWELKLARNEIYARHGRRFKDSQLQDYFDQQSWYNGIYEPDDFDKNHGSEISALEKKNAEYILKYEKDHGYFT